MHTFELVTDIDDGKTLYVEDYELEDMAEDVIRERIKDIGLDELLSELFDDEDIRQLVEIELGEGDNKTLVKAMTEEAEVIDRCEQNAVDRYRAGN